MLSGKQEAVIWHQTHASGRPGTLKKNFVSKKEKKEKKKLPRVVVYDTDIFPAVLFLQIE